MEEDTLRPWAEKRYEVAETGSEEWEVNGLRISPLNSIRLYLRFIAINSNYDKRFFSSKQLSPILLF